MNQKIEIIKGDITTMKVDVIVNAANSSLLGGGGVVSKIRYFDKIMFVLFSIIGNNPERVISNSTGHRPVEAVDKYFTRLKALKRQNKAAALTGLSRITGLRFVGLRPTLMLKGRWPFGGMKRNVFIVKNTSNF